MKKTLLIIACYSTILVSAQQVLASVKVDFAEYVPFHYGNSWTLVDEFNTIYTHQIIGTECFGTTTTYEYAESEETPNYDNYYYLDGALVRAGLNGVAYNPPFIMNGQDIFHSQGRLVYDFVTNIVTPVGTFDDVIKLTFYNTVGSAEFVSRVRYYAKGVGLIRDENWCASCGGTYTFTALLTSYEVAGPPGTDLGTCIPPTTDITLVPIYHLLLK